MDGGEVPELAKATRVDCLDIASGHWTMFTRADELADLLAGLADERVVRHPLDASSGARSSSGWCGVQ